MSRKSPGFTWYPDSWFGGTRRMSRLEKSVYFDLLNDQWVSGGFSLGSAKQLCSDVEAEIVERVLLDKFSLRSDGLYYNERLEQEREKQEDYRKKQAENGKRGGRPKAETETQTKPKPNPSLSFGFQKTPKNETQTKAKKKPTDSDSDSDSITDTESERESSPSVIWMIPETFKTQEFCQLWESRCKKFLTTEGRPLDEVQGNAELMELCRRGYQNAVKDLQTTVLKGYGRTICEHDKFGDQEKNKPKKPLFGAAV